MVSALDLGLISLVLSPGLRHCVVFLSKTIPANPQSTKIWRCLEIFAL